MRLFLVLVMGAALAAGCKAPRLATPADLAPVADEIVVTNRSRATGTFANETFGLGPYQVTRVHRGGTSSSSSGFTVAGFSSQSEKTEAFYDFDLASSVGTYKGVCGLRTNSSSKQIGNWVVGGSGSSVLDCNCSGAGPGVTRVYLELAPQARGVVVHRSGAAAPLMPSTALEGGGTGTFMGAPLGYEAGGQPVGQPALGAVEVTHPGRVWINRTLAAGEQADLACLFTGLLLYHPPTN